MAMRLSSRWYVGSLLLLVASILAGCASQAGQLPAPSTANQADPTATATTSPVVTPPSPSASATVSPTAPATGSAVVPPTVTTGGTTPTSPPASSPTTTSGGTAGGTTAASSSTPYSFPLLPPGSALPSEAFCAAQVQRSSWEPRPENYAANHRIPTSAQIAGLAPWDASIGLDPRADQLRRQMTGAFTGTTDEILQWVACKWGVPVDIVRAEAVVESYWRQDTMGDQTSTQNECPPGTWNGSSCAQSYGILQIMYQYNVSAWPMSRDDTAFSAEYVYGMIRACYEGWTTYLSSATPQPGYPTYHAGDLWGCLGRWYSGTWYDQSAITYINKVKAAYNQKTWRSSGF